MLSKFLSYLITKVKEVYRFRSIMEAKKKINTRVKGVTKRGIHDESIGGI